MKKTSWKIEVRVGGTWSGNALRFATKSEAEASANELLSRWFVPDEARAVESEDPVNYYFDFSFNKNVRLSEA